MCDSRCLNLITPHAVVFVNNISMLCCMHGSGGPELPWCYILHFTLHLLMIPILLLDVESREPLIIMQYHRETWPYFSTNSAVRWVKPCGSL